MGAVGGVITAAFGPRRSEKCSQGSHGDWKRAGSTWERQHERRSLVLSWSPELHIHGTDPPQLS